MRDTEFRQRVVLWLSHTQYARYQYSENRLREIAHALGVTYDVLVEARLLFRERQVKLGRAKDRFDDYQDRRRANKSPWGGVCLHMGRDVKTYLQEYAKGRGTKIPILFRSVLHRYLQGVWEPPLYESWEFLPGIELPVGHREVVCHPRVSLAARRALEMRAELRSTTAEELGRSLVVETVKGNFGQVGALPYITGRQMFQSVLRYRVRFEEDAVQIPERLDFTEQEIAETRDRDEG